MSCGPGSRDYVSAATRVARQAEVKAGRKLKGKIRKKEWQFRRVGEAGGWVRQEGGDTVDGEIRCEFEV